ncbi:ankyrin repeat domain-containing protein [Sphingomonas mesophila]|uniref:ankyrin repeat domain-containing protein n=1 Tax=Sphingomonas mesophila TaxID=2303576 RepID=UPI000E587DAA|nr:ankyrin repeat domain-containing protein [Sphingomonas mesophila]
MTARWSAAALGIALGLAVPAAAQVGFGYAGPQLLKAVREGDGAKATELLDNAGPSAVNYRGGDGDAALHVVTRLRSFNWIGFLLQKGADPNLGGRDGDTPLIIAARAGFSDGVERLLDKGANLNKANRLGATPLIAAVQQRQPAMVRLLLEKGADPARTDAVGYTARDYAKRESRFPELLRLIETVKPTGAAKLKF